MEAFAALDERALVFKDARGDVTVLYEHGPMVLKRSRSFGGVFRGMHLQLPPCPQTKIIRVVSGGILDFVVNPLNEDEPIFYSMIGPEHGWVLIASHFAHGFYAQKETLFEYICDGRYSAVDERVYSISHLLESELGLTAPNISDKDKAGQRLDRRLVHTQIEAGEQGK